MENEDALTKTTQTTTTITTNARYYIDIEMNILKLYTSRVLCTCRKRSRYSKLELSDSGGVLGFCYMAIGFGGAALFSTILVTKRALPTTLQPH